MSSCDKLTTGTCCKPQARTSCQGKIEEATILAVKATILMPTHLNGFYVCNLLVWSRFRLRSTGVNKKPQLTPPRQGVGVSNINLHTDNAPPKASSSPNFPLSSIQATVVNGSSWSRRKGGVLQRHYPALIGR